MPHKIDHRELENGHLVKVHEAKHDLTLTFTAAALRKAKDNAQDCAIAVQARMSTGRYFEVHRSVAFEQLSTTRALRYRITPTVWRLLVINDLAPKALKGLVGYKVTLKAPTKRFTRAFWRSKMRKRRDAASNAASRKRTVKREYLRPLGDLIDMRSRALP